MTEFKESLPEDFREGYVVVPEFRMTTPGIIKVMRGDMTDDEWKTWTRVKCMREIKRLISTEGAKPGLSTKIFRYLTDHGITVCRVNSQRPIL